MTGQTSTAVQVLEPPQPLPTRSTRAPLAIAFAAVFAVLAWFGSAGAELPRPAAPEAVPGVDLAPIASAEQQQALDTVAALVAAIGDGDIAAAEAWLDDQWIVLILPGAPRALRSERVTTGELRDTLAFVGASTEWDLYGCDARRAPANSAVAQTVSCFVDVTGVVAEAQGLAGSAWLSFGVRDGQVAVVSHGFDRDGRGYEGYCLWSEQHHPELAALAFDPDCRAVATPDMAETHRVLAEHYVAAGRPPAEFRAWVERRSVPEVLDYLDLYHRLGAASLAADLFAPGAVVVGVPFTAGETRPEAVFAWSTRMIAWAPHRCAVDARPEGPAMRVVCADVEFGGPLLDALDIGPVAGTIALDVSGPAITRLTATPDADLDAVVADLCRWARNAEPRAAPVAFTGACRLRIDPDATRTQLELARAYAGGPHSISLPPIPRASTK